METVSWVAATSLLALAQATSETSRSADAPRVPPSDVVLMHDMAADFRALEEALRAREMAGAKEHATSLAALARVLVDRRPRGDAIDPEFFARYAQSLVDVSLRTETSARESRLADFEDSVERARATCVACHVRYRDRNAERGMYPGMAGTITGQISISSLAKKEREDRSGVLVFVEGAPFERPADLPLPVRRISQRERRFDPRVLPLLKGSTVEFPNDDFVYHNVFSLSETQPFDLGAFGPKQSRSVLFPRTGVARVYCNIHPEMVASIVVLDNPYFALSDDSGFFVIAGVPAGSYPIRLWHELGGAWQELVTVTDGGITTITPAIHETKGAIEHKNKFGRPYRGDYK